MKATAQFCLALILLALSNAASGGSSDWLKSPRPKFPPSALKSYSEGSVKLRILLANDGTVRDAKLVKGSGNSDLDTAAHQTVLKWKMKPSAIRPSDLSKGREEVIEFRQEAPIAARHPDRSAAFTNNKGIITNTETSKLWMFAPFPSYPLQDRERHHEGVARIGVTIGKDGKTEKVHLKKSSGYATLDDAALRAVALWRAHKQYAGRTLIFPVRFQMGGR